MTKMVDGFLCSLCDEEFQGIGNNAAPFKGVCCNDCNTKYVIMARISMMGTTGEPELSGGDCAYPDPQFYEDQNKD